MSWFTATATWPFWVALLLILGIAVLEGIGLLLAVSPSNALDAWLPDFDDAEWLGRVLGWLHLGRLPSLVLLLLFLTGFALFGFALQHLLLTLTGHALPAVIASLLAIPAGLAGTRSLGGVLVHVLPRDESSAVSDQSFVGRSAIISAGHARRGHVDLQPLLSADGPLACAPPSRHARPATPPDRSRMAQPRRAIRHGGARGLRAHRAPLAQPGVRTRCRGRRDPQNLPQRSRCDPVAARGDRRRAGGAGAAHPGRR